MLRTSSKLQAWKSEIIQLCPTYFCFALLSVLLKRKKELKTLETSTININYYTRYGRLYTLCLKKGTPTLSIVTFKRIKGF